MKKLSRIMLAACAMVMVLGTSCQKEPDINEFAIAGENLTVGPTTATFAGSYVYDGTIKAIKVRVGLRDDLSDGSSYAADLDLNYFTVTVEGLSPNTEYKYCYAVDYGAESDHLTETRSFTTLSSGGVPPGIIDGLFTINDRGNQVYFSQGNLQYQASTNTWRFATNQWDYVGDGNENISSSYSGWIDLFGWGTSGYNHGATCYQPWSTNQSSSDYYAYGSSTYNLNDQTCKADWGYNRISNGGNTEHYWRTLTKDEWTYVFDTRSTPSGIRYAKATVG